MNRFLISLVATVCLLWTLTRAQDSAATPGIADSLAVIDTVVHVDIAAQSYAQQCAGCHSVGGGKLTGPDLLPTRAWPKPELAAKIKLMEARVGPLTTEQIDSYVELLQDARAQDRVRTAQELAGKAVAATLEPASETMGKRLFDGTTQLANGGIACITCHRAGAQGGTFGPDLTLLGNRMGKVAMISAIQQSSFRVMSGTYKPRPITAQEAVHLGEYLATPDEMPRSSVQNDAPIVGAALGVIGLLVVVELYRNRSRGRFASRRARA